MLLATYTMLAQHGISSLAPLEQPQTAADGSFDSAALQAALAPWLDPAGLGLSATRLPWMRTMPWTLDNHYGPSSPQLMTYLTELCATYKRGGWQDKAYGYIMDETTTRAAEKQAELYARALHAASAKSGFRMDFLLTDDPRPTDLGGVKQANSFLFDDVDIWGVRYFYFFGRVPALRREQAAGKQVWWYPYYNGRVATLPNFVIEKPNTDQRVWGWLMEQWNVDGLINWAINRWVNAATGSGYRDPYQDPLTWSTSARQANGDSSLIYPGYYPAYGLTDPSRAAGLVAASRGAARRSRGPRVPQVREAAAGRRPGGHAAAGRDHAVPVPHRAEELVPLPALQRRPRGLRGRAHRGGPLHRGRGRRGRDPEGPPLMRARRSGRLRRSAAVLVGLVAGSLALLAGPALAGATSRTAPATLPMLALQQAELSLLDAFVLREARLRGGAGRRHRAARRSR